MESYWTGLHVVDSIKYDVVETASGYSSWLKGKMSSQVLKFIRSLSTKCGQACDIAPLRLSSVEVPGISEASINPHSAEIDFSRQDLTSVTLKSIPAL